MIHTSYLADVLDKARFKVTLERAARAVESVEFDAIACTGNSGTLFCGALSNMMGKSLLLVRKPSENSHVIENGDFLKNWQNELSFIVEGDIDAKTYVFVDDLIFTGGTFRRVRESIAQVVPHMKCVATYQYQRDLLNTVATW